MFTKPKISISALVLLFSSLSAQAGIISYTDLATFQANSTTSLTTFDPLPGPQFADVMTIDGNTYDDPNSTSTSSMIICGPNGGLGCSGQPFDSNVVSNNFGTGFLRIGFASGTTAAGGLFGDLNGPAGTGTMRVFGLGGSLLFSDTVSYGDMGAGEPKTFFGFTTTAGDQITFIEFDIGGAFDAADDIRFGTAGAIPEPATTALLFAGLASFFTARRRRSPI